MAPLSTGRRILSLYLDLVVLSVLWAALQSALAGQLPDLVRFELPIKLALFVVAEILFFKVFYWSPGDFLLSIHRPSGSLGDSVAGVDARIKARESWLTLLAATLFLLEGCKSLSRWMWALPPPFFGTQPAEVPGILFIIASGLVECLIAYLIFRVNPLAIAVGVPYLLLAIASTLMSWNLWPEWGAEYIARRRAYQGLGVGAQETASLGKSAQWLALSSVLVYLVLLLAASFRLLRGRGVTPTAMTSSMVPR